MKTYKMLLLSIIIPIFNVREYIRICVDSILNQSYKEYELILVDDGSNDGCSAICDEYALNDTRVKVVHKENGGLSDARNAGICAASAEYLLFIDGDDFIAENALAYLADALAVDEFPDILFLLAMQYFNNNRISRYGYDFRKEYFYGKSKDAVLKQLSAGSQFHVSAWVKSVRRTIITDNNIFFTKGIIGEDVDFSVKLYLIADTYSYLDVPYYFYRQGRAGSIMTQKDGKRFRDLMYIITKWVELSETAEYEVYKNWILRFLYHQYYVLISLYRKADNESKTRAVKMTIRRLSYILKYTDNKKATLLYVVLRILGINFASYLINLYEGEKYER